jgi:catechol 2,3-dioxygenase-like lactoylglutathione lyase family enzyme
VGASRLVSASVAGMPRLQRVLETSLYCDDPVPVAAFYRDTLGAAELYRDERLVALDAGGGTVLLLFRRGASTGGVALPTGTIPPHDGDGPAHLALAIRTEDLAEWERRLAGLGVAVESRVRWPRGGESLYLRDPAGHSVELATPGVWTTY